MGTCDDEVNVSWAGGKLKVGVEGIAMSSKTLEGCGPCGLFF